MKGGNFGWRLLLFYYSKCYIIQKIKILALQIYVKNAILSKMEHKIVYKEENMQKEQQIK